MDEGETLNCCAFYLQTVDLQRFDITQCAWTIRAGILNKSLIAVPKPRTITTAGTPPAPPPPGEPNIQPSPGMPR